MIETLFPRFNELEVELASGLTAEETRELSRLLRKVITTADPPA